MSILKIRVLVNFGEAGKMLHIHLDHKALTLGFVKYLLLPQQNQSLAGSMEIRKVNGENIAGSDYVFNIGETA